MNMQAILSLILFLTCFMRPILSLEIGCFVDGECLESTSIGVSQQNTSNECLESCKETKTCQQFTHYADASMCILFTDCILLSDADCNDCVSGDATCESLVCNEIGECSGALESVEAVSSVDDCIEACISVAECSWWNFDTSNGFCTLLSSCDDVTYQCPSCTHGSRVCGDNGPSEEPSIIFIAGGSDSVGFGYEFDVEVLDLKDSNSACAAIPDAESSSLFSTANTFQGKAVFCGGDQTERKCYIFNPDSYLWENFAHLIHPRQNHASIQLSEDSFWILGGKDAPGLTSEYYDPATNSFVEGPALPAKYHRHCAAKHGETIVITGGASLPSSFVMFDWDSQSWTHMPRIPTGRDNHGCEIIDTENGKELWVIGGYGDGHCFDSVEIFNFDTMQWSTGTPLPGPRAGLSTTVIDNNILVIGGSDDNFAHSVIWEWSTKFNRWTQSDVELDGPRSFFGATLVDERSGATCSL